MNKFGGELVTIRRGHIDILKLKIKITDIRTDRFNISFDIAEKRIIELEIMSEEIF